MKKWIVKEEDAGKKLVTYLHQQLGDRYSARQIKKWIESNLCRMDGRVERFASAVVRKGYCITFDDDKIGLLPTSKAVVDLKRVLFEDEHYLLYNKPVGVTSDEEGILSVLREQWPGLILVHRLDRDTTGVIILAKSSLAFDRMVALFQEQSINKTYWAIVQGVPEKREGVITNELAKIYDKEGIVLWGEVSHGRGSKACTEWSVKKKGKDAALMVCVPKTGRTHQIRVHMKGIGHPILGDFRYNPIFRVEYRPLRPMLHAKGVAFKHPFTGAKIYVEAPPPPDFVEAANAVGVGA